MFWQLIAHLIGDYFLQSDWMAMEKTKKSVAALAHVLTYALPFLFLTRSTVALMAIIVTHFVIDRWRLARYICWAKNWLAPKWIEYSATPTSGTVLVHNYPWLECVGTGYHSSKAPFMGVWLMIIVDNTMHIICNALALQYL